MEDQQKKFIEDLEASLNILSTKNNIQLLEKITENFILMSQNGKNPDAYIMYQVQVFNLLGQSAGPIINFLKSNLDFPYSGRHREAFRRIHNLRTLSGIFLNNAEKAYALPHSLATTFFSYNERYPHEITMMLLNNNQTAFSSNLDFNGALNLINQLLINLEQKLHRGHNNIEMEIVNQFKEANFKFSANLDELVKEPKE
jgi:hypothetical protein